MQPRVVAAVGTAVHCANEALRQQLEDAMSRAVELALADGVDIQDSEAILRYKQEAFERVLAEYGT